MNELIKIQNQDGNQVVSAQELYDFLELNRSNWSRWSEKNIVKNQFAVEGEDWTGGFVIKTSGNETNDFYITTNFAKKLAMTVRTVKGEQVRSYFIECERLAKEGGNFKPLSPREILLKSLEYLDRAEIAEQKVIEMQPKADFFDEVTQSKDVFDFAAVAKIINRNMGRNQLFEFLRNQGVLRAKNEPYQSYVDRGWFKVIETKYTMPKTGDTRINIKTVVFQKGIDGIIKLLDKNI